MHLNASCSLVEFAAAKLHYVDIVFCSSVVGTTNANRASERKRHRAKSRNATPPCNELQSSPCQFLEAHLPSAICHLSPITGWRVLFQHFFVYILRFIIHCLRSSSYLLQHHRHRWSYPALPTLHLRISIPPRRNCNTADDDKIYIKRTTSGIRFPLRRPLKQWERLMQRLCVKRGEWSYMTENGINFESAYDKV